MVLGVRMTVEEGNRGSLCFGCRHVDRVVNEAVGEGGLLREEERS